MTSLNARIVESLFLMPDGRTDGGWRKVCEQVDNYGQIDMNTQTGEATMGRWCTLVLENLREGTFWGTPFAVATNMFGTTEPLGRYPWRPRPGKAVTMSDNLMIKLVPLDKVVITTFQPKRS
jgi:hypothetical protein